MPKSSDLEERSGVPFKMSLVLKDLGLDGGHLAPP